MIFVPAIEIFGFQFVADRVGGMNTLLLTLLTSAVGVAMMRFEGRKAMEDAKQRMNSGMVPVLPWPMAYVYLRVECYLFCRAL